MDRSRDVRKVLLITLGLNLAVSAAKLAYGHYSGSVAITSDGFHSMFDGVSNVVGLIGIHIASRPPDDEHPYGHRKYETVFTIAIGLLMLLTCFEILKEAYHALQGNRRPMLDAASLAVMIATLGINLFVVRYERDMGMRLGSEFLIADSLHTRTDIFVTLGVMGSIICTMLGYPILDPIAGFVVAGFVAKSGFGIIKEATDTLVDTSTADIARIETAACSVPGAVECHAVRARGTRSQIFVDIHVLVDPGMSIGDAHDVAEAVEKRIKDEIRGVVDVVVHMEPATDRHLKRNRM